MDHGEKIAALRKARGMTQAELGEALNVTFQAVSKWERGDSCPDFLTVVRIAKFFGVSLSYFDDDTDARETGNMRPTDETVRPAAPQASAPAERKASMISDEKIENGPDRHNGPHDRYNEPRDAREEAFAGGKDERNEHYGRNESDEAFEDGREERYERPDREEYRRDNEYHYDKDTRENDMYIDRGNTHEDAENSHPSPQNAHMGSENAQAVTEKKPLSKREKLDLAATALLLSSTLLCVVFMFLFGITHTATGYSHFRPQAPHLTGGTNILWYFGAAWVEPAVYNEFQFFLPRAFATAIAAAAVITVILCALFAAMRSTEAFTGGGHGRLRTVAMVACLTYVIAAGLLFSLSDITELQSTHVQGGEADALLPAVVVLDYSLTTVTKIGLVLIPILTLAGIVLGAAALPERRRVDKPVLVVCVATLALAVAALAVTLCARYTAIDSTNAYPADSADIEWKSGFLVLPLDQCIAEAGFGIAYVGDMGAINLIVTTSSVIFAQLNTVANGILLAFIVGMLVRKLACGESKNGRTLGMAIAAVALGALSVAMCFYFDDMVDSNVNGDTSYASAIVAFFLDVAMLVAVIVSDVLEKNRARKPSALSADHDDARPSTDDGHSPSTEERGFTAEEHGFAVEKDDTGR